MGVFSSPSGIFPLIQALPNELPAPIRDFQNRVDAALHGPISLTSLGTGFNEPAQYSLGSTAALLQAAQGTHSVAIDAPVSTVFDPGVSLQFFRKNGSGIGIQSGYYLKAVHDAATDAYGIHQYTEFSADLAGSTGRNYNIHGVRSNVVLFTPNPGTNTVFGFAGWAQTQKYHYGYAVGYQVEANNLTLVDDQVDPLFGFPGSVGLMINMAGTAHATSAIHLQSGNGSVDAAFNGITTEPNALCRYLVDGRRALFTLQGTITFTNGSATISGSGTKFIKELHQGDTVIASGVAYTISSDPVSDTSATLTVVYAGTTAALTSVLKPVTPLRITANSYICSARVAALTDSASQLQYRLLGLNNSDQLSIDPDARGSIFGGKVGVGMTPSNVLDVLQSQDAASIIQITNSNAGVSSQAAIQTVSDNANLSFKSHSTGRTGTRYGITLGGYNELLSNGTFGLIMGNGTANTPIIFGRNSLPALRIDSNITATPEGNWIFNPTGKHVDPATNYDINLGAIDKKYLTFWAAELGVETIVAQDTIATIGGNILVPINTTVLTSDLTTGATSITVKHNAMISGDRVYMQASGKVEFMAITSSPSGSGPYVYTVTRDLDGTGANAWNAGDAVVNTGQTGNGFIELYSLRGVKSSAQVGPAIVGNIRNSSTYNDWTEHWAIGNLNGKYGYSATEYGVGLGKYASGTPHVTIDATSGYRQYLGTSVVLYQVDNNGNAKWGTNVAAASTTSILISNQAQTYNSETLAVGDVLFGDNTAASNIGNVKITGGILKLRKGVTDCIALDANGIKIGSNVSAASTTNIFVCNANQVYNGESIVAGDVLFGDNTSASGLGNIRLTAGAMKFRKGLTDFITLDATDAQFTNLIKMKGASAAISIGSTPPTSGTAGTGVWIDRNGIVSLTTNVQKATFSASGITVIGQGSFQAKNTSGTPTNFYTLDASGGITEGRLSVDTGGTFTDGKFLLRTEDQDLNYLTLEMSAAQSGGSNVRFYHDSSLAGVTIGANKTPNAMLTVTSNTATPPTAPTGAMAYFVNVDSANTFITADAYGTGFHSDFVFRMARGTMASPSACQSTDIVAQIQARGYGATGFASSSRGGVRWICSENWTDTAQGMDVAFLATPTGSATIGEVFRITGAKVLKIAGTAARGTTEGTNHLDIFDGTAPVGTLTNGVSLYSTSGELRVMDSAGNATLLSPHDDEGNWIHDEINFKGRRLRVDMERLLKALDKLLGGGFIEEYTTNN